MNRLASETSPYLRQHADNPVEWYPWGPEAFDRAVAEDKPLFVSIGYASCHWCHVMAHESFEDPAIGALLGRSFVSIKVDREERPDVDALYMGAAMALIGSGGWPLSIFCTPDGRPFHAGTYYPPTERSGMPAFRTVLDVLADAWSTRRSEVEQQADALTGAVADEVDLLAVANRHARPGTEPDAMPAGAEAVAAAVAALAERFDPVHGGFGPAPKFPRPSYVELCLRHHGRSGDPAALAMATTTLDEMAAGGIYDHLVGGFCRYATDERWLVPHFEKMLTDQALLARAYLHAWQSTGNAGHLAVATETIDYALDELGAPGGGLYSSQDADAAGVEGGHATFTPAEVLQALSAGGREDLVEAVLDWYGITEAGDVDGRSVPHRPPGAPRALPGGMLEARGLLVRARRGRPQPATDDKVLTEWNAMFASSLAEAAAATGDPRWARRAEQIMDFLFAELRRPDDGRWLRSWQNGRARHLALSADVAWVVDACTRLAELTGLRRWSERAVEVADTLLRTFWDGQPPEEAIPTAPGGLAAHGPGGAGGAGVGGLLTVGHDAPALIARSKDVADGAVPSANSVAAAALLRVGALSGLDRFRAAGERIVALATPLLNASPLAVPDLVAAVGLIDDRTEVVVAGDRPDLVAEVHRRWTPTTVLAWGEPSDGPLWEGRTGDAAHLCHGFVCRLPTADPVTLRAQLDEVAVGAGPGSSGGG
ncbi:MAG TPA: thioredoxin domain-containing protein [Acidimicrobiales bacterium]